MDTQRKVACTSTSTSKSIKVGPWGGHGGTAWDDGSYSGIRSITLMYDRCIDSIRVEYDKHGKPILAERHGGNGGTHTIQIKLECPEEYLTTISGYIAPVVHGGYPVIRSLRLKSNRRAFGPFGIEEGTPFTFPMEGGMIVGFCGRGGWYLDAVGLYLTRVRTTNIYGTVQQKLQKLGNMASKTLAGNKEGEHGAHARPKPHRSVA